MTRDQIADAFISTLSFNPYPYQEEALLAWFSTDAGLLICAPTGTGKTLLAEAAVFEALKSRTRLYYTTPLIALTDQKFREMQDLAAAWGFAREDIGLITGNRRENPDALVRVVVAEILLNHLLSPDPALSDMRDVSAVVMDEFHSFADPERGVVWELSLVLLPPHVRVMLLSATVGNPYEFADWLRDKHNRKLTVVTSAERRVPLEFIWVDDKLMAEQLPAMITDADATNRSPALVFCFNRDECWDLAERLKGLPLITDAAKKQIEAIIDEHPADLADGVGPKLRQMLIRGVGVHHAGVLPRHKGLVEQLFLRKLVPLVVCTETLAAGINLPARSVVLSTLLKGKHGDKKLIPSSAAHQMFGRAGRPQFDTQGYVYVVAHEDDVKIKKWKEKYDKLDAKSKDPGILRLRKDLERKRPSRRTTEQYWSEGQLKTLIAAGPAKLYSRAMIPYQVLIYLLTKFGSLSAARDFLDKRFAAPGPIEKFHEQLTFMVGNLAGLGYVNLAGDGQHVTLNDSIHKLLNFRSIDPLYGMYLAETLPRGGFDEKVLALESVLEMPPVIERKVRIPEDLPIGPLQLNEIGPLMIQMGVMQAAAPATSNVDEMVEEDDWQDPDEPRPPTFPEMLKLAFEAKLPNPEPVKVQPKWLAGDAFTFNGEFFKYVKARDLLKQEGLILRHLLRLVILAGEFFTLTQDPSYMNISEYATQACQRVDAKYTARFLADAEAAKKLLPT